MPGVYERQRRQGAVLAVALRSGPPPALIVFRDGEAEKRNLAAAPEEQRRQTDSERAAHEIEKAREAADADFTISYLAECLGRMAEGDPTCSIASPFDSRFERLRLDFNSSIEKLRTAMLAVIGSANEVNETTGEIAAATNELARRTEAQAVAVEEFSHAMDALVAAVNVTSGGPAPASPSRSTATET